jgi:hypothetical protein
LAKAKIAPRKSGSKRRKASAKFPRKAAARRTTTKKIKSRVRRASGVARRAMAKEQRPPSVTATEASRKMLNQVVESPMKDTIANLIQEAFKPRISIQDRIELKPPRCSFQCSSSNTNQRSYWRPAKSPSQWKAITSTAVVDGDMRVPDRRSKKVYRLHVLHTR